MFKTPPGTTCIMSSLSKVPCNWRSSENAHAHGHACGAELRPLRGRVGSVNTRGPGGVRASPGCALIPTPGCETVCHQHTLIGALLRRECHGLKIAANPSSGLVVTATAAATAGESWPRGCRRQRSACGTETPAARRQVGGGCGRWSLSQPGLWRRLGMGKGGWKPSELCAPGLPPSTLSARLSGLGGLGDSHEPVTTAMADGGSGAGAGGRWRPADGLRGCLRGCTPGEWGFSSRRRHRAPRRGLPPPGLLPPLFTIQHPTGGRRCFQKRLFWNEVVGSLSQKSQGR